MQAQHIRCGHDHAETQLLQAHPHLSEIRSTIEQHSQAYISRERLSQNRRNVASIPVVFHVVWQDSAQRVPEDRILAQLATINQDFRRLNADTTQTPGGFVPVATDTEIEFCLASVDPDGFPTSGILYTQTSVNQFTYTTDEVKFTAQGGSDAWSRDQYLNIWICNLDDAGPAGYAYAPGAPADLDGVVMDYLFIGGPGNSPSPDITGRICTHEIGHWLNLKHVWGDGDCTVDDDVADTPPQDGPITGCPSFPQPACDGNPNGSMFMNYMQYTEDTCMNLFTQGQALRMQAVLAQNGPRNSLLSSPGCGVSNLCSAPSGLQAINVQDSTIDFAWDDASYALQYEIRYRLIGSSSWENDTVSTPFASIGGLDSCETYEAQVRTLCVGEASSTYGLLQYATTGGCAPGCDLATPLGVDLTETSATISWSSVPAAIQYQLQIRNLDSLNWTDTLLIDTSFSLTQVPICSDFVYRLQSICQMGVSGFSLPDTFASFCDSYCLSKGQNAEEAWIESVGLGFPTQKTVISGPNGGNGFFVTDTFEIYKGIPIPLTLTPGYADQTQNVTWTIWIDLDGDLSFFSSPDEKAFIKLNTSSPATGSIEIPREAMNGPMRMRVQMKQGGSSLPCDVFPKGEVEDYTLFILGTVGVEEDLREFFASLSPNPAEEQSMLRLHQASPSPLNIALMDVTGRLIRQEELSGATVVEHPISLSSLPTGIYWVRIRSLERQQILKLFKL